MDLIDDYPNLYNRLEQFLWNLFTNEIYIERETDAQNTEYEIFISFQLNATVGVLKYWIKNDFNYSTDYTSEQLISFYSDRIKALKFKHK